MKEMTQGRYYGSQDIEMNLEGMVLSRYGYTVPVTDWHYHENPYFMFVLGGKISEQSRNKTTLCPAGSIMLVNSQEPHCCSQHCSQSWGFHLEFKKEMLIGFGIKEQLIEGNLFIYDPRVHLKLIKIYHEFMKFDEYSLLSIKLMFIDIIERLIDPKKERPCNPEWVKAIEELIYYDENAHSLGYISEQLQLHPVHISRSISKYFSVSLAEYLRMNKLIKALPLLAKPSLSLTEIAYQSGFSDQSHFNRVFKNYFDAKPMQWRKILSKAS